MVGEGQSSDDARDAIPDVAVERAVEAYRAHLPRLDSFRSAFEALVRSLLDSEGGKVQHVESRCKNVQGYREKVRRKSYADPDSEMTDVVGVRVIVYYQDHVGKAAALFEREFDVDTANSSGQRVPSAHGEFGYRSYHLVISLDKRRGALPEWQAHASQKVELQIRSVLDHAWAEVEHELFYERSRAGREPEPRLWRRFKGLMADLERVDDGFIETRDRIEEAEVIRSDDAQEAPARSAKGHNE